MTEPGLLLIRGLGHSGSTILDLALGAHPQLIGLGEAVRVLERPRLGEEHKGRSNCGVISASNVAAPVVSWPATVRCGDRCWHGCQPTTIAPGGEVQPLD